jgi:hypothetical protein
MSKTPNSIMKKISLALSLTVLLGLASCEVTPENIASGSASFGVVPADPVIVGTGTHTTTSGKTTTTYYDVWVMNSDGSNKTNVRSVTSGGLSMPSWSPSSSKIVWREAFTITKGKGNNVASLTLSDIKIGTVTVSNGVPTLTSVSTLLPAISGSDTMNYNALKWSSSTSADEIATWGNPSGFNSHSPTWKLKMVNASSGAVTDLWQAASYETLTGNIAFNYDGTKVIVGAREKNSNPVNTYMNVIDRSSGTVSSTILGGWAGVNPVNGSHTGADQLLFIGQETSGSTATGYIYDFPTSTLTALATNTTYRAFTPDNTKLLRNASSAGSELYTINGGATSTISSSGTPWDWKR